ncbi:MAG: tetratricopeptide repeat protein [Symploca sp. SIO1B1]|nr:tetratricopeptide repeat protein [Symploca sp. SIO1B1]
MPRRTYGTQVKARARRLFEALLAFVNGELEGSEHLDIQYRWHSENSTNPKLVVITKLRALVELTQKDKSEAQLHATQVREALHLMKDFLGILEDNRVHKRGSENWHFTLTLWSKDQAMNLKRFDQEWEHLLTLKKSKQEEITSKMVFVPNNEQGELEGTNRIQTIIIPHNLPYSGAIKFVGRAEALSTLHQKLQTREQVVICAISGMGGMGKTELALQYAQYHQHQGSYSGGMCWLQAGEMDLGTQIVNFARAQLEVLPPDELDLPTQVAYCWQHWREGEVLVVLDDVRDYQDVKSYLPPAESRFKVLITTRQKWLGESFEQLNLEVLSEEASLELLVSFVGKERIEQELKEAKQLCKELGFLPLGLELVGRYLKRKQYLSLAQMRQRLELEHRSLQYHSADMTAKRGVAAAFELSWQELDKQAQVLGCLLSLFALAPISWKLVEKCLPEQDQEDLEDARDESLLNPSLLERRGQSSYQLHQLIREFFSSKLEQLAEADKLKRVFCQVMAAEAEKIPKTPTRRKIAEVTPTIPHLVEAATTQKNWLNDENLIKPFIGLSRFYEGQGNYTQAVTWGEQCCLETKTRLGNKHPDVATSINNMAELYLSQGRYDEVEPLYLQALQLRKKLLGNEHPDVAASINNLAGLYLSQGRYDEVEPLIIQALQLRKKLLGNEHPDVAASINNLAGLYLSQGRYDEAEPLYLQALQLRKKFLGNEHPDVAASINNLAGLYLSQGRYDEAEPLYLQALQLRKKLLGNEHPDVAASINNLAELYFLQGRDEDAETLYLQAPELKVVDWNPYLSSICQSYAQWWKIYTLTNVVVRKRDEQKKNSPLLNLGLMVQTIEQQQEHREEREEKTERLAVVEGLRKYAPDHVLLLGRPGSGKSTALVRLLLEEAERGRRGDAGTRGRGDSDFPLIPVLVELRYYQNSVLERVQAFLQKHQANLDVDEEILKEWLRQGQLLLLFDGFNELPSEEARQQLKVFRQDYPNTPMIFTTRELGVGDDLNIPKKLEMQPLTKAQMREFICAYLPQQGERMLKQLGNRLREFGETPLLLWMLCSVFASNSNKVPSNLGSVFRHFTEIYDYQLKKDIPTYKESRDWWQELLQHLAWVMTQAKSKTELQVAIRRQEAEAKLTEFLQGKVDSPDDCARRWLKDLLNYHLIQLGAGNQIEFKHQLFQEYYTAENLLRRLASFNNEELKWNYLNYLKWTEPLALMLDLAEDEEQALRVVKLALELDWQLGARLAGEVKPKFQEQTIGFVAELSLPQLLKVKLAGATKSDAAIPGLIQALQDSESHVRISAAEALGQIGSDAAIPGLIQALEDSESHVRISTAEALGQIGSDVAIPRLIQALEDSESHVRMSAIKALSKIDFDAVIPRLIQALEDSESHVRISAVEALGQIGSDAAIPGLIQALEDSESHVRISTAEALGQIGSDVAIPRLIQALEDSESHVRISAAEALGQIGSDVAIPRLIQALQDSDEYVRISVIKALNQIDFDAAIPGLIQALQDSESHVRISASEALGQIGSDAAIPELIKALQDNSLAKANSGNSLNQTLAALETIQERCQYYKPPPKLTMPNPLSHNYALLIGVGESTYPRWSLPVTVKDTQALKSLLTDQNLCGYINDEQHLRLLQDAIATNQSILAGLDWLKQQATADSEATVLVYYSGHGWLDDSTGKYYLIPHDVEPFDIPNSALAADTFKQALRQIPAKRLLVIIDSCHAAGTATAKNRQAKLILPGGFVPTALPQDLIDELKQGSGRAVFTSSAGEQQSWIRPDGNMSIYTYHFLEALQGAGNQPGDKVVTVSNLMNYVGKTVPASTQQLCQAEQTPFFDIATEDFPVALLHGGKGLLQQGWDGVKSEAQEKISSISVEGNNRVSEKRSGETPQQTRRRGDTETGRMEIPPKISFTRNNNKITFGDRSTNISIGAAGDINIGDISSNEVLKRT